jgi:hypothetical protein
MSTVSPISSSNIDSTSNDFQSRFKQRKENWDALENALSSGNLQAAQTAFAAVKQDIQSVRQGQGIQAVQQGSNTQQLDQDMQNLEKALSSGDLTAAQQAFAALKQQGAQGAHHHHHHHSGAQNVVNTTPSVSDTGSSTQPGAPTVNLNV